MDRVISPELVSYVEILPAELRGIFTVAHYFVRDAADTLGDDFQIAAEVLGAFKKYAARRREGGDAP